jgi:hypothetical protein
MHITPVDAAARCEPLTHAKDQGEVDEGSWADEGVDVGKHLWRCWMHVGIIIGLYVYVAGQIWCSSS